VNWQQAVSVKDEQHQVQGGEDGKDGRAASLEGQIAIVNAREVAVWVPELDTTLRQRRRRRRGRLNIEGGIIDEAGRKFVSDT